MTVRDTIAGIIEERRAKRIIPDHATMREVYNRSGLPREETEKEVRGLFRLGVIHMGRTLNDYYIKFAENDGMEVHK